jgi:hypothetical protein
MGRLMNEMAKTWRRYQCLDGEHCWHLFWGSEEDLAKPQPEQSVSVGAQM